MRLFVISLPTQFKRREFIRSQFERLGMEFSFYDAVDVRNDKTRYFRSIDAARFRLNMGRNPVKNEIGCYASHLMLWRTCITLGEPIVILEDDARLDAEFASAMSFVESQARELGFIRLEWNSKRPGATVSRSRSFSVNHCPKYPYSAMAYAVSPEAAAKFIDSSQEFSTPVDKFIKDFWIHGQPLYQLSPHIVEECDIGLRTTIGERHKNRRRSLSTRLRRMHYKVRCWLLRLSFNLAYRYRYRRRIVTASRNVHEIPATGPRS